MDFGGSNEKNLDKAMENLSKFSSPIFEITAKEGWGGSKSSSEMKPGDQLAAGKMMMQAYQAQADAAMNNYQIQSSLAANNTSFGEKLLGAAQGAITGIAAGKSVAGATGAESDSLGGTLGGIVGGLMGLSAMSDGRTQGVSALNMMNGIAGAAATWDRQTKTQIANDAVASFAQRMGQWNHPTTPQEAVKFSAEKDKIVSDTAKALVVSGVAPDKALQTAKGLASIYDPGGQFSDTKTQAAQAMAEFYAIPNPTEQDKEMLRQKLNTVIMSESIASGKLPANYMAFMRGLGVGGPTGSGPAAPAATAANAPLQIDRIGPDGPMPTGPTATPSSGGPVGPITGAPEPGGLEIPNKPANTAEAKQAFGAKNAWTVLDKAEALIKAEMLPSGSLSALQANLSNNGVDMGAILGPIGGIAGGFVGGPAGIAAGAAGAGALGHGMGKIGQGASWGMDDQHEMALSQASQYRGQLQTYLGQMMGNSAAGRSDDMKDIINAALGAQGDSIEERLAAIKLLREMIQSNAKEIGAFSEEKPAKSSGGNVTRAKSKPGMFFFD